MHRSISNNFTTHTRYLFNGMEADNEVSGTGNSYTTEFRQYDPRLGHWKSLDPLIAQFPWQSPYCAFDNNPIFYTDPFGLAAEGGDDKKNPNKVTSETNTGKGTESSPHQIDEIKVTPKSKSEAVKKHETNPTFQLGSFSHPILESGRISDAGWLDPIFILAEEGLKAIGINEKAANVIVSVVPLFIGSVKNPVIGKSNSYSKVTKSISKEIIGSGKFTKTIETRPSKISPGQSRAEYVRYKNNESGKTIRSYKDSYDRSNNFKHRKPTTGNPEGNRPK